MTDQQTYTTPWGDDLIRLRRCRESSDGLLEVRLMPEPSLAIALPTTALLAMIDTVAPDAMRAYLRETAPEVIADLYRPEIPEADSPEDVDEHPEPVITVTPEALDAAEQLGRYVAEIRDAFARGIAR